MGGGAEWGGAWEWSGKAMRVNGARSKLRRSHALATGKRTQLACERAGDRSLSASAGQSRAVWFHNLIANKLSFWYFI